MKKIFLLPILALFVLAGCSDLDEPSLGVSNKWVQFDQATYKTPENLGSYRVPVLLASNSNPDGVTVNFTVESDNTGFTYSPSNGTLTIPAGEFVGYIDVTLAYDPANEITENYQIKFNITGSEVGVGLAGQGKYNVQTILTVTPSACAFDVADFIGDYTAAELGYDTPYTVTAAANGTNSVKLTNLFDSNGTVTLTFDNSNPAAPLALFTNGEFFYTDPTYGTINIYNPSAVQSSYTSTFDTCTQEMTVYFAAGRPGLGYLTGSLSTVQPDNLIQKVVLTKN